MSLLQSRTHTLRLRLCTAVFFTVIPALTLTNCASSDKGQFPALTYTYLAPINFNVGRISIQNLASQSNLPGDVTNLAPVSPADALQTMAKNRFKAMGNNGQAIFVIDRASIQKSQDDTVLVGQMDTHMDVYTSQNQKAASVEAHVSREFQPDPSKGDADSKSNLYSITKQMMQDMNVELEYQIRKHLDGWLVDASGNPITGAIQTQQLGTPLDPPSPFTRNFSKTANSSLNNIVDVSPEQKPATSSDGGPSAIFPTGNTPANSPNVPEVANNPSKNPLPSGVLGTLPQSALPSGY